MICSEHLIADWLRVPESIMTDLAQGKWSRYAHIDDPGERQSTKSYRLIKWEIQDKYNKELKIK